MLLLLRTRFGQLPMVRPAAEANKFRWGAQPTDPSSAGAPAQGQARFCLDDAAVATLQSNSYAAFFLRRATAVAATALNRVYAEAGAYRASAGEAIRDILLMDLLEEAAAAIVHPLHMKAFLHDLAHC